MDLLSIVWDVSPYVYQFSSTYAIRWYGILFATAFVLAYYVAYFLFRKEHFPEKTLNRMAIAVVVGGVLGSRLGHCFFYDFQYYRQHLAEILYLWRGGMSSHGGAIGVLIAYIFVARKEISYKTILARTMVVTPIAAVFFRMGNLMNSEIYGVETDLPWGFIFVNSSEVLRGLEQAVPRHPTQIYEMICYALLFITLLWYVLHCYRQQKTLSDWFIIGTFLLGTFATRFIIEFYKMPQVAFEQGMTLNMGQWLSVPFIVGGIICLIVNRLQKTSKIQPFCDHLF